MFVGLVWLASNHVFLCFFGRYTYDVHFGEGGRRGGGGVRQNWDVIGRRGLGGSECSGRPIFIFFIKKNWAVNRHHVESNIIILLTRNLPISSDARQWSHPLMIPKWTIECVANLNVTWLDFVFVLISFVRMHSVVVAP